MRNFLKILLVGAAIGSGCQNSKVPPATVATVKAPQIDSKTLSFRNPGTGHTFSLHLGDAMWHDTGGNTKVPANVKFGMRDATSSYYEPTNEDGAGYAAAESLYTRDQANLVAKNTNIQYQPDTGRLLITEDKSDGTPCRRYILYTRWGMGYKVSYLAPGYTNIPGGNPIDTVPSNIRLLPADRAEINGKVLKIDAIPQSDHPFSVGG